MHHWNDVRRAARKRHRDLLQETKGDRSADALLAAAERTTGFRRRGVEADNPLLDGGEAKLDRERNVVWYNADVSQETQWFYQAHEFAHAWLETGGYGCLAQEIDEGASEDKGQVGGVSRIEGYNPRERDEREANVFAREFLVPTDALRTWTADGLTASAVAARVGVSLSMVLHQLSRALLVAESLDDDRAREGAGEEGSRDDPGALDDSQEKAAEAEGPVLVVAGPGTGKTRTLTGRTVRLVQKGVDPERILALTFSNRAAEEMRSRVGRVLPSEAHRIWMGTFHAFGLELLLKHNERAGLPIAPRVLDPVDASMLMEGVIVDLDLYHYRNLPDPGLHLPKILGAISRAKDEVVGPAGYAQLADRMRAAATTDDEIERAEKAQEVAHVYAVYQELLAREGALDFGDLIARTVLILEDEAHADLCRALQDAYPHVLVDEYQDVNRASARLLKAIAGDGAGLWVVGDPRQAIYRWRGASTENVKGFGKDYPGATIMPLQVNYRSRPRIVATVAELAPQMKAAPAEAFEPWASDRDEEPGEIRMEVASTMEAEGLGLARLIDVRHEAGVAYRDQAVLCRSHTLLERYARLLEREGVPVLYLGDVFERPEVRDMLALVSLTCDGGWNGLVRVATFPEYRIPLDDVERVVAWAREERRYPLSSLAEAVRIEGLSPEGALGLTRLRDHLDGVHPNVPTWDLLARHLFERSRYLECLEADSEVEHQQKRLALYQLLALAHGHREREGAAPNHPRRSFLHYVRRLAKQSEDRQIRQVPEWADDIDAVRLLTVHASKGLEFEAVYVPALAKTYFPSTDRPGPCPPPDGLIDGALADVHDEEEECLFFVAISRARDTLLLSRADRYLKTNRNPSVLLPLVAARLPYPYDGGATWTGEPDAADPEPSAMEERGLQEGPFSNTDLGTYMTCPRRYYYERVLGLSSWAEPSPFLAFHRAVRRTIRGIIEDRSTGASIVYDDVRAQLDDAWGEDVLAQSPYGSLFRVEADRMVNAVLTQPSEDFVGIVLRPEWTLSLDLGDVTVRPDAVRVTDDGAVIERWKTGRVSKGEADKDEYALYHTAASELFDAYEVRAVTLADREQVPLPMTDAKRKNRLKKYHEAIGAVAAGQFPANPSDRECPVCPFYFICPA